MSSVGIDNDSGGRRKTPAPGPRRVDRTISFYGHVVARDSRLRRLGCSANAQCRPWCTNRDNSSLPPSSGAGGSDALSGRGDASGFVLVARAAGGWRAGCAGSTAGPGYRGLACSLLGGILPHGRLARSGVEAPRLHASAPTAPTCRPGTTCLSKKGISATHRRAVAPAEKSPTNVRHRKHDARDTRA